MRTATAVAVMALVVALALGGSVCADVLNMPGGQTSLEFVTVGGPPNAPDTTGYGAVDYAYKMGKYEVTAGQYCEFLNAVADTDTYSLYNTSMWSDSYGCKIERIGSSGSYSYNVASDWANRPVSYVSWGDAVRFVNWLTNGQPTGGQDGSTTEDGAYYLNGATSIEALLAVTRTANPWYVIPTEDEWYKAAYYNGESYYGYPTGTDSVPSNALIDPDPGNNANFNYFDGGGLTIGTPYYRTPVSEFENSESPYGTFDQGGNVWEWNETILYESSRGWRGGSFLGYPNYLHASDRSSYDPTFEYGGLGFRVSEVPEPATLTMLALGGLALLRRRRTA